MAKKLGLALGAGSSKGFAHIGVLQVLEEEGIKVDMVAGCSMGAVIGSIYCAGTDLHMLEKYLGTLNLYSYFDLRNPLSGGFVKGEKMETLIRMFTHNFSFEQTRIPFVCVATDLIEGKLDVLDAGPLHEAVRASMSIPAIFEPVQLNGKTYVDGGVLERVPCKTLRERGMDVVLGVDVGYHGGKGAFDAADTNAYQVMNRMIAIMQWDSTRQKYADADLMLVPEVLFVKGRFSTEGAAECVEEGRRVSRAALPRIKELLQDDPIPLTEPKPPKDRAFFRFWKRK